MTTKEKVAALLDANPRATGTEMARELGVSKQRISQILRGPDPLAAAERRAAREMLIDQKVRRKAETLAHRLANRSKRPVQNSWIGTAAELIVAADLIHKGMFVYRSMSATGPCDLIATDGVRCWRVEVKNRWPVSAASQAHYHDVLAGIDKQGGVQYAPPYPFP